MVSEGKFDELKELEKRCLLNNAKFKDWECTEEVMATTKEGKALYMHCLPADITESVANRASAKPACLNATASPSIRKQATSLHHRRDDLLAKFRDPPKSLPTSLRRCKAHRLSSAAFFA